MLEQYIRRQRQQRDILLMTHIVLGYPNLDEGLRLIEAMVTAGVELIELQIPFSEPMADGPVIVLANQKALANGTTVDACLRFAEAATSRFDVPFLFMTYANLVYRRGVEAFTEQARAAGIRGLIVPDLPPEESAEYLTEAKRKGLDSIFIFAPTSTEARLAEVGGVGSGFIYCVARKGVTGMTTAFSEEVRGYLQRARQATTLPLAVGFGVKDADDVSFLRGLADVAVVGSQTLRVFEGAGTAGVQRFLKGLRPL